MARTVPAPPEGVALSQLPTIRGKDAAHEWINNSLGVPIRKNLVVTAANKHDIGRVIAGALHFSTQELFEWVMGLGESA